MPTPPPFIATLADVRGVSSLAYAAFMPHRRVLAALEDVACRQPDRIALTGIDDPQPEALPRRWTHAQLVEDIRRAANLFHRLADGRPSRVALLLPPMPETHLALWGAETAGVACPINFQLNQAHVAELIRAVDAQVLVALGPAPDLDIDEKVDGLLRECPRLQHVLRVKAGPDIALRAGQRDFMAELKAHDGSRLDFAETADDTAALFHTGGTTGAPKLARHTHANQLHAAWGAACMYGTRPTDVILNGFPLFHVAGSFVFGLSTLLAGGEVVLPTRTGLRNAALMARLGDVVERFGVTLLAAVPTVIASLLALNIDRERLRAVRALLTGGSPLPDELAAAFENRHGIPVRNILGMTESAGVISIEPLASARTPGSCGLALPFTTVVAVDAEGVELPPGGSGILRIQGPNVSPGYTEVQRNAGTFEDGWLVSGDIGHVDAEGRVFVTGRAKDVIIRGAHNIDPGMIESVLLRHPSVMMAAAVGEPDAYAGELPVAFVSLKPGHSATAEELLAFIAPLIAERPALPKRIHILQAVPMTAVGKVYKPRLRAEATHHAMVALLAQGGLQDRVQVEVEEAAGGPAVRYTTTDPTAEAAIRELMKPFALRFAIAIGGISLP
jgi:fatty-acyl-CoA synthase